MADSNGSELETAVGIDDSLGDLLGHIWNRVIQDVNRLLEIHNRFGTFHFKENLNPSLDDVLKGFEFVDFALKQLIDSGLLEYDEARRAINSRQCILKMRELAVAMNLEDVPNVERVIRELKNQAQF